MNVITASYASSDSDVENNSDDSAECSRQNTQPIECESGDVESPQQHKQECSSRPQPISQQVNTSQNPKVNLSGFSKQLFSLHMPGSCQDQRSSVLVDSTDNSQTSLSTESQNVTYVSGTKRSNTKVKPQQRTTITALDNSAASGRKETVMPYIPKAKRKKYAGEQECLGKISSNNLPNSPSLVFKNAQFFPKKTISHYFAPKRRLIHLDAHQGCINKISWNPCYKDFLLSASMDTTVKIWSIGLMPTCVWETAHSQAVKDAKWSVDGLNVLSCGYDKFLRITDVNKGKEICAKKHGSFVTCVIYHPSDANVYLSGTSSDGIFAWDLRTQQYICRYKSFFGQIQDLVFLPDGQSFISAAEISRRNSTDKGIMVWDYKTSTVLSNQVFQEAYTCTALQIHPNDNTFLAQCNAGYIAVFHTKYPYKLNKYKRFEGHCVSGYHIGLDISPDGCLIASGSSDGSLYIYNYRTSNIIKTFTLDSQPCMDVAWSPTVPSLLASCDWKGRIFLQK